MRCRRVEGTGAAVRGDGMVAGVGALMLAAEEECGGRDFADDEVDGATGAGGRFEGIAQLDIDAHHRAGAREQVDGRRVVEELEELRARRGVPGDRADFAGGVVGAGQTNPGGLAGAELPGVGGRDEHGHLARELGRTGRKHAFTGEMKRDARRQAPRGSDEQDEGDGGKREPGARRHDLEALVELLGGGKAVEGGCSKKGIAGHGEANGGRVGKRGGAEQERIRREA